MTVGSARFLSITSHLSAISTSAKPMSVAELVLCLRFLQFYTHIGGIGAHMGTDEKSPSQ
jgi:hypothetical protein